MKTAKQYLMGSGVLWFVRWLGLKENEIEGGSSAEGFRRELRIEVLEIF